MELFATLCLYTYIADQEPELLPLTETFPLVLHDWPTQMMEYRRLIDFETRYNTLPLDNYLWFSGHFMQLASMLYAQFGNAALERMWQMFVLGKIADVSNGELQERMVHTDSALAAILGALPEQYA